MLTYPLQEAEELLESKLTAARKTIGEVEEDLEWLREQLTVMEVNFARVHNVRLGPDCPVIGADHRSVGCQEEKGGSSRSERDRAVTEERRR